MRNNLALAEAPLFSQTESGTGFEDPSLISNELAQRRANSFKGHIAIEGLQAEYDAKTEFAELVDGQMRVSLELTYDDRDVYGPDGRSLIETGKKGLAAAREQAKKNPNLWFEVGRRSLELEEILKQVDMVKNFFETEGDGPNTLAVTTDYPWELEGSQEDVGGYNRIRRQALRRVLTIDPNGKILLHSQTWDGSNRRALEAVDADLGFQTEAGPMLGQRHAMKLTAEEQATFLDRSTSVYDHEMAAQFGGEWYAGRRPVDYRNTYDFVCQQRDLIEMYKTLKLSNQLTDRVMYDMAATLNARFERDKESKAEATRQSSMQSDNVVSIASRQLNFEPVMLYQEMKREGMIARRAGKSFSACGSTLKAEGDGAEGQLENIGYGKESGDKKSWHGGKKYKNTKCLSCEQVKAEVGACRICEDCVKNPKKHKLGTTQGRTGDPKKAKVNEESAQVFSFADAFEAKNKAISKTK